MQNRECQPSHRPKRARVFGPSLLAFAAAMTLGSAAYADTFSGQITLSPSFNSTNPGFQIKAVVLPNSGPQDFVPTSFAFTLVNIGDSFTTDIFVLRTLQTVATFPDDGIASPFGINFALGGLGTATIAGTTFAQSAGGFTYGVIDVSGPATIDVGGGRALRFDIADGTFNRGSGLTFTPGKASGTVVGYTATLVSAVPEPGTWAMMLAGLAGIGFVARRKQSSAAQPLLA